MNPSVALEQASQPLAIFMEPATSKRAAGAVVHIPTRQLLSMRTFILIGANALELFHVYMFIHPLLLLDPMPKSLLVQSIESCQINGSFNCDAAMRFQNIIKLPEAGVDCDHKYIHPLPIVTCDHPGASANVHLVAFDVDSREREPPAIALPYIVGATTDDEKTAVGALIAHAK